VKFCVSLGKTHSKTCRMLCEACRNKGSNKTTPYEWHRRSKSQEFQQMTARGLSELSYVAPVKGVIHVDRRLTVRKTAERTGVYSDSCYIILSEDLGMHLVSAKFMPKHIPKAQIIQHISACKGLQRQNDCEILLKNITTEMRPRLTGIMSKLNDN
jgi:hypothetical protein